MADTAEIDQAKARPEYRKLKQLYGNREWRLDNLYWIIDKKGDAIRFKRNLMQRTLDANSHLRDCILKARKLGASTYIDLQILDASIFRRNVLSGIIDYTIDDAAAKLEMIKFAYHRLPEDLRKSVPLLKENEKELVWANGSSVSVGLTFRGGTPRYLHVSEFGKTSQVKPDTAKEIVVGAIQAVPQSGKVWVESTAHGTGGEFHDMVRRAERLEKEGTTLLPIDFKVQFFGWHMDSANRVQNNLVTFTDEIRSYFADLEARYGIKCDADQRAWYMRTRDDIGPDAILSEHPSVPNEAFFASLEGAYFKKEMNRARLEKRIGLPVPYDPMRPVNTFWDIGMDDETVIVFHQTDGVRHRIIDYVEQSGEGLHGAIRALKEKQQTRGFIYASHFGPHDLAVREWTASGPSRYEIAKGFGIDFDVVPKIEVKADSIEAARAMLGMTWIDQEFAGRLVAHLDNYSKKWNKTTGSWMGQPAENGAQHAADAFQQGAMGLRPERERSVAPPTRERKGTQWGR